MAMSSQSVPPSDELDDLFTNAHGADTECSSDSSFFDAWEAHHQLQAETKHFNEVNRVVIQHRVWNTADIFHSDPEIVDSPNTVCMPMMASSPPPTPLLLRKRKAQVLDLGRSTLSRPAKAQKVYYGIDIHQLLEEAQLEQTIAPEAVAELPTPPAQPPSKKSSLLWTEKYRARKFTDLIGDERTHRAVMHWLKRWDAVVYPGSERLKTKSRGVAKDEAERPFRKVLMLTGPAGLGKTTLAHVCAKQAGYEVQEINASDERSSAVVKGRIRDMLGTENVRGIETGKPGENKVRKAGKPVCVVVDEVDGVVTGSGGSGEGGFMAALIDLLAADQKSSTPLSTLQQAPVRKKKSDAFRMRRPLILICNDVYHPSLRPLRKSSYAEVIHVRKAPVQNLITRLHSIFGKEGVPCETDGVRRLCEATWGFSNRKEDRNSSGPGEGDMRGIMVVGEWVARKLRADGEKTGEARLTRRWVEDNVLRELSHGGSAGRGGGSGGSKDLVDRIFDESAGFPKSTMPVTPQQQQSGVSEVKGVAEGMRRTTGERLRELVDTHGDTDRIVTDCFSVYPERPFQDDNYLSKPDAAYQWLHFHDRLSTSIHSSNDWELAPYLSTPVLGFHHLFASATTRAQYAGAATAGDDVSPEDEPPHPFTGSQASWAAHEATKHNESTLQTLQSLLTHDLSRTFNSTSAIATDLLPYLLRMLSPNINPVLVGGSNTDRATASVRKASEQQLVSRSVRAMAACGVRFDRIRVQSDETSASNSYNSTQWIYRMEPPLDELGTYSTAGKTLTSSNTTTTTNTGAVKTRFAVRQVLDDEWKREEKRRAEATRLARFNGGKPPHSDDSDMTPNNTSKCTTIQSTTSSIHDENASARPVKRDFFGRPILEPEPSLRPSSENARRTGNGPAGAAASEGRVWITYHEGFSNAVRKPLTMAELMRGL